jgi:DNA anti-recombination protein RmuC
LAQEKKSTSTSTSSASLDKLDDTDLLSQKLEQSTAQLKVKDSIIETLRGDVQHAKEEATAHATNLTALQDQLANQQQQVEEEEPPKSTSSKIPKLASTGTLDDDDTSMIQQLQAQLDTVTDEFKQSQKEAQQDLDKAQQRFQQIQIQLTAVDLQISSTLLLDYKSLCI